MKAKQNRPVRQQWCLREPLVRVGYLPGLWLCACCVLLVLCGGAWGQAEAAGKVGAGAIEGGSDRRIAGAGQRSVEPGNWKASVRRLRRASIGACRLDQHNSGRTALKRLVEQVRSVKFVSEEAAEEKGASGEAVKPGAERPAEDANVPEPAEEEQRNEQPPDVLISGGTLSAVKAASEHPEQVADALGLAEVLYRSGHLEAAVAFYREALHRRSVDVPEHSEDRAWILFQLGTCLRRNDLAGARQVYSQLVGEYPDSPWAGAARGQVKLIDWLLAEEPERLLAGGRGLTKVKSGEAVVENGQGSKRFLRF